MSDRAMVGDSEAVLMGGQIRQAGWDQVPWVDGQWPPMNEVITIRLTSSEWLFAVDQLRQDTPVYESLGNREAVELGLAALDVVLAQLP